MADSARTARIKLPTGRIRALWLRLIRDTRGQDMIEYALMAGFITVLGSLSYPRIAELIGTIFGHLLSLVTLAAKA